MKIKFHNNARLRNAHKRYLYSNIHSIADCYKNPSVTKILIAENIDEFIKQVGGYNPRIISYNTFVFTVGFMMRLDNELVFVYVTPYKTEYMLIK